MKFFIFLFLLTSFSINAKEVLIEKGLKSVPIIHQGEVVNIQRNQDRSHEIMKFYQGTWRGKIQPLFPFGTYPVETVAELEVIEYINDISHGDEQVLIIDARPQSATIITGMIPTSIRVDNNQLRALSSRNQTLTLFGVNSGITGYDYTNAKILVIYCNGLWCGKSPKMIRKLIALGYPPELLKYYRGGMQAWRSVGLTTV
ncbi:MAG: sulfurtransferase, partial [Candidatus Thioglobus sp.]|uniref:rhodanese-like domain-containing protein n=1 Tax=Candidatus Thioglobus sp. TaxID=2026721 RepID=UPI0025B7BDCA